MSQSGQAVIATARYIEFVNLREEVLTMSDSTKVLLGVLGGTFLVLVLVMVFVNDGLFGLSPMGQGGMMHQQGGWGPGSMMNGGWEAWGLLWMLVPLLFWGGLLALVVWAVVRLTTSNQLGGGHMGAREESAEEILKQRFARGEIDAEEFEERCRILAGERNDH